jgi:hypothetical protein
LRVPARDARAGKPENGLAKPKGHKGPPTCGLIYMDRIQDLLRIGLNRIGLSFRRAGTDWIVDVMCGS